MNCAEKLSEPIGLQSLWRQALSEPECYGDLVYKLKKIIGSNLALNSDVDQDTFGKVTKNNKHDSQEVSPFPAGDHKATRNRHDISTHTNMKHNKQKRSTKEAPPWNGQ